MFTIFKYILKSALVSLAISLTVSGGFLLWMTFEYPRNFSQIEESVLATEFLPGAAWPSHCPSFTSDKPRDGMMGGSICANMTHTLVMQPNKDKTKIAGITFTRDNYYLEWCEKELKEVLAWADDRAIILMDMMVDASCKTRDDSPLSTAYKFMNGYRSHYLTLTIGHKNLKNQITDYTIDGNTNAQDLESLNNKVNQLSSIMERVDPKFQERVAAMKESFLNPKAKAGSVQADQLQKALETLKASGMDTLPGGFDEKQLKDMQKQLQQAQAEEAPSTELNLKDQNLHKAMRDMNKAVKKLREEQDKLLREPAGRIKRAN